MLVAPVVVRRPLVQRETRGTAIALAGARAVPARAQRQRTDLIESKGPEEIARITAAPACAPAQWAKAMHAPERLINLDRARGRLGALGTVKALAFCVRVPGTAARLRFRRRLR